MNIIDLAIRNRTAILVLVAAIVVGGLIAYLQLPKESQPQIEFATIIVTTVYPGASPDDIESLITREIEREVATISGIDVLRSTSTEGVSTVVVEFLPDKDIQEAKTEVRDRVDLAKTRFPPDVEEPLVNDIDFSQFPVLTVNLLTEGSLVQLRRVAEELQDELESLPGVQEVDLIGGLEREVQVNVNLTALQGYNLTIDDIVGAIQGENTNVPGGSLDIGRENYLIRIDGEFRDPLEIRDIVVTAPGGVPVYVRDVAEVTFGFKDRESYARLRVYQEEDGEGRLVPVADSENLQVIRLNVKKRAGDNIIDTVARVQAAVDAFEFPSGVRYVYTGDQSEGVRSLVTDLENNIIAGIFFVIGVLLFFLGARNATLVGIAIPLSMFLSFLVFAALGQTLNFIILFSLIIALGMLVDNAVVIVENIYRFREEGYGRWEAARLGTKEVGLAVAASTATTVAAFAPMLLWPGIIGRFMSYLPLTLIITLSSSLFVAIVINPVITGLFVRLDGDPAPPRSRAARLGGVLAILVTTIVILIARWQAFVVLSVLVPALYLSYRYALGPAHRRFAARTVPRVTARYRAFLTWMLRRDYSAPRALLRNTFALGSFTLGFVLLVLGGAVAALAGLRAALILLAPGGLLLVVGLLGIVVHALESAFLGRKTTVFIGAVFGAFTAALVAVLWIGGRVTSPLVVFELLFLPVLLVVVGGLGMLLAGERTHLLLTDNRARLLTGTFGLLVGIVVMFQIAPTGVEFFPTTDPQQVNITAEAPLGTNLEASDEIADAIYGRIAALIANNPAVAANVRNVGTSVGVGGDVLFGGGAARPERSQISLNMVDYADRAESSAETLRRIRAEIEGAVPGVDLQVEQNQNGPPTGAAVNIEISGREFAQLVAIAADIRERLERADIAGLVDVTDNLNTGRPEYRIEIDRERAATFGLSTQQIALAVRGAVAGVEASRYRDGRDEYDITVRLREDDRASLRQLESLTILHEGRQIPLVAVAEIVPGSGLGSVTRLGQQRVVTVSGEAAPGFNGNAVLAEVQRELEPLVAELPEGYTLRYTGESEEQRESFGFLFTALLIGIAGISIILIAQFNSVKNPFIIMVAVGLSLIGVLLGLILTRTPFGLMTFIGVISLAGIVVNNAIVLVDYIEQLRARGLEKMEAIVEGGATRLRPVVLTALTTVIGLIPLTFGINVDFVGLLTDLDPSFAFGSENTQFWGPMGTAIISGLTFATFLTLVIVPVMYSAFDSLAQRLGGLFRPHEPILETAPAAPGATLGEAARAAGNGAAQGAPHPPDPSYDPEPPAGDGFPLARPRQ
ncbi:MAG: efflux RND transporter permease subunit [Rubricoccaceae bacterium]